MAKLKVNTNTEAVNSFMPYDGPVPKDGSFNAVIRNPTLRNSKNGNPYINAMFELEGNTGDDKKYNGFPLWGMVHFVSESENVLARFNSFIKAVGGNLKDSMEFVHESEEDMDTNKGSAIKSVAGTKVDGKKVRVTLRTENSEEYGSQLRVELVSPLRDDVATEDDDEDVDVEVEVEDEDAEVDVEDDEDSEDEDDVSREDREKELKKESLADLKAAALEAEIDIKGLKKADLVAAILEWEFEDVDDEDEDDEESDEDEEIENSDDEETEDDEEEDEEEEDEEAEIRAELADLDRTALKKRLKELDEDAKVLKSNTDDDLRDKIVGIMTGPPF